jgi:nucleoside phosphorylase
MVAFVLDEMGPLSAAVVTGRLVAEFAVRLVALVGIAGALIDNVGLGDVVMASKVDRYEHAAKAEPGDKETIKFKLAGNVFQGSHILLQVARNLRWMPETAQTVSELKKPGLYE